MSNASGQPRDHNPNPNPNPAAAKRTRRRESRFPYGRHVALPAETGAAFEELADRHETAVGVLLRRAVLLGFARLRRELEA